MLNKALNSYRYYVPILVGYIYNYTVSQLWVKVSKITSGIARRKGLHEDIKNRTFDQVFLIDPQFHSNKLFSNNGGEEKVYGGHNLTSALKNYVEENLSIKPISISLNELIHAKINSKPVVITWIGPNPKSLSTFLYFIQIIYFSIKLYKKKIPVITYLPDTWFPDAAIVASILNALTCGTSVLLQSSISESVTYGYPAISGPIVWVFPPSRIKELSSTAWTEKTNSAVLSFSPSGGLKRIPQMLSLEKVLNANDFSSVHADGTKSQEFYLESLRKARIVATTNFTQDGFYFGSKKYKERISPLATTGMNWEAFSAKALLITNPTEGLEEQGFIVGVDYLDINYFLSSKTLEFPSEDEIRRIAENGHNKFIRFTNIPYLTS
jgi:hypothetical protein